MYQSTEARVFSLGQGIERLLIVVDGLGSITLVCTNAAGIEQGGGVQIGCAVLPEIRHKGVDDQGLIAGDGLVELVLSLHTQQPVAHGEACLPDSLTT